MRRLERTGWEKERKKHEFDENMQEALMLEFAKGS
jgi:hypothetical protein